ncbi:hypothetical protein ACS0TY_010661 [Phlomoides rotata]
MGVDDHVALVYCDSAAAAYGKKLLKRFVWRVRAEMKKKKKSCFLKKHRTHHFTFCYDPMSYALNFDDGNFGFFCT